MGDVQKRGPATQNSSLAKGFDDDIALVFSQIHGSFQVDITLGNNIKMFSVITLLKNIFTSFIRIHLAEAGDLRYFIFSQQLEKLTTFQCIFHFFTVHNAPLSFRVIKKIVPCLGHRLGLRIEKRGHGPRF